MDTPYDVKEAGGIRSPREGDDNMDDDGFGEAAVGGGGGGGGGGGAGAPAARAAPAAVAVGGARVYPIPSRSYVLAPRPGYSIKSGYREWDIDHERFEIKKDLGKGSYGAVVMAIDHLTGKKVAIKRITDIFSVFENAKRIFREVRCPSAPPPPGTPPCFCSPPPPPSLPTLPHSPRALFF